MESVVLRNCRVVGVDGVAEGVGLTAEDGIIVSVGAGGNGGERGLDCTGLTIFPGFIDVHNHGAVGFDVNEADAHGLRSIAAFLIKQGVTAWVPTLVPDSDENYARVISAVDELMAEQASEPIAQAVGVHYEGVFANQKMCGALRPEFFKTFCTEIEKTETTKNTKGHENTRRSHRNDLEAAGVFGLPTLKAGAHMTTFAPEVEGGVELAAELTRAGWIASIGHTRADTETLERAMNAGARHVTHFFNAMTGIHHRDVGVAGWALTNPGVSFDIIADGIHVNETMLEFACRSKTPDRSLLISDSVAPTGLGEGTFDLWGERISVVDGRTQNERGSIAGSVITILDAVRKMLSLGFSESEVAKMASLNPAKLLGIDKTHGSIQPGKRADLVAIDEDGDVKMTILGGRIAYLNVE